MNNGRVYTVDADIDEQWEDIPVDADIDEQREDVHSGC